MATEKEKIDEARKIFRSRTSLKAPKIAHLWDDNTVVFSANEDDWLEFCERNSKSNRIWRVFDDAFSLYCLVMLGYIMLCIMFEDSSSFVEEFFSLQTLGFTLGYLVIYFGILYRVRKPKLWDGRNFIVNLKKP